MERETTMPDQLILFGGFCASGILIGLVLGFFFLRKKEPGSVHIKEILPIEDIKEEHRAPSFSLLLNQLLAIYRTMLSADGVVYLRKAGEGLEAVAASPGTDFNTSSIPLTEGLYGIVVSEEKEVIAEVVQPQALRHLKNISEPSSILYYPILRRGEVLGIIAAHRNSSAPFSEKDALSIKRGARFLDEMEIFAARQRKLEYLRIRWEKTEFGIREMLKEKDPTDMAGAIVRTVADILPLKQAFIVIQSSLYNYGSLVTHGFPPPDLETIEPNTWVYWLFTHNEDFVFLSREVVKDTKMSILFSKEKFSEDKIVLLQKLKSGEHTLGIAGMIGSNKEPFSEEDKAAAQLFLKESSALLELSLLNISLQELAVKDALTTLYNKRYFIERFRQEFLRSQRTNEPVCLMMIDIDHFKNINDTHGHPTGDAVLKEVALRIKTNVREMDIVSRYGGEEFVVILPSCKLQDAFDIGERIRKEVASKPVSVNKVDIPVTVSAGISSYPESSSSEKQLLQSADEALLYQAKKGGRNRVALAKKK